MNKVYISKVAYIENEEVTLKFGTFINTIHVDPYEEHSIRKFVHDAIRYGNGNLDIIPSTSLYRALERKSITSKISESKNVTCFEIIKDSSGNEFARDIYTKDTFPILNKKDIQNAYNGKVLSFFYGDDDKKDPDHLFSFKIKVNTFSRIEHDKFGEIKYFIYMPYAKLASPYEVEEYISSYKKKGIFGSKEDTNKRNNLSKLSKNNPYIEETKDEVKPIEIVTVMENIERLLIILESKDKEAKEEYQAMYEDILNNENNTLTLNPLTIQNLKSLERKIEFTIEYGKVVDSNIFTTLNNMIQEYFLGYKTERTIDDLDKLAIMLYKNQDNYSYSVLRRIFKDLALLYVLEIHENIDNIDKDILLNSHFNKMLTTALIVIHELIKNGIIENNVIIDLNSTPSLNEVLDIIKQIKFTEQKKRKIIDLSENI